jgi:hypothetical protein
VKGQKVYFIISECKVVGAWSNLTSLTTDLKQFNLPYYKIYRQIKKHTEGGNSLESFAYDFTDMEGKAYQLKIEILQ